MGQNQHYVPQAYLRRFLNSNQQVYTLRKDALYMPDRIKEFSPKATGKQSDFYLIKDKEQMRRYSVEHSNFIEVYFAQHQDLQCNKLLDILLDCTGLLAKEQAAELVLLLLSFKLRSPELRKTFENKEIATAVFKHRLEELMAESEKAGVNGLESILPGVEEKIRQFIDHPDLATNVHTDGILSFFSGQGDIVFEVAAMLLNFKWHLLKSEPNSLFVTSDNPGFIIDKNLTAHNLNFGEAVAFFFPISPSYCLICAEEDSDFDKNDVHKIIYPLVAASDMVRNVNANTYKISHKYIYSNDELALKQTWDDLKLDS